MPYSPEQSVTDRISAVSGLLGRAQSELGIGPEQHAAVDSIVAGLLRDLVGVLPPELAHTILTQMHQNTESVATAGILHSPEARQTNKPDISIFSPITNSQLYIKIGLMLIHPNGTEYTKGSIARIQKLLQLLDEQFPISSLEGHFTKGFVQLVCTANSHAQFNSMLLERGWKPKQCGKKTFALLQTALRSLATFQTDHMD